MTAPQTTASGTRRMTWFRTFPGQPEEVGRARRFLAGVLGDCQEAEDAILCLSELAANAVQHSRSGSPGGEFSVRIRRSAGTLAVEVIDEGGPWVPGTARDGNGRGLAIVRSVAGYMHISDLCTVSPARTVAFEMRLA